VGFLKNSNLHHLKGVVPVQHFVHKQLERIFTSSYEDRKIFLDEMQIRFMKYTVMVGDSVIWYESISLLLILLKMQMLLIYLSDLVVDMVIVLLHIRVKKVGWYSILITVE